MSWKSRQRGQAHAAPDETGGAGRSHVTPTLARATDRAAEGALMARFWGVRGSYPTPRVGGGSIGGETTCLEIRYGGHTLIIDAGSGVINLGEALMKSALTTAAGQHTEITLLLTHAHHDHLCGLPFFAPLYDPRFHVRFFGPDLSNMRFEEIVAGYMRPPYFPVDFRALPSRRTLRSLADGERLILPADGAPRVISARPGVAASEAPTGALMVDALFSHLHPADGTMLYRVSGGGARLVFATDVEIGAKGTVADESLIEFARGADALIHDAQYSEDDYHGPSPKRGYGHSTPQMAARIAAAAGVGRLILTHHDPHYNDAAVLELQRHAQARFPEVVTAREGLELRLDAARRRLV